MAVRIDSNCRLGSLPTSSVMRSRSSEIICEVLATESLGRPVLLAGKSTLPGASAHKRLLVNGTQTTVRTRLRLSASPWTTTTGRRNPGPEPVGFGKSAQYTWPWAITIRPIEERGVQQRPALGRAECRSARKRGSSLRSRRQDHGARYIQLPPPCRPDCATFLDDGKAVPLRCKPYREWRSQFSYPKYNQRIG
jgi:hypothetical protein